MKGLIIKNFCSLRKVFKTWIITTVGMFGFLLLLKIATLYGNLKDSFEIADLTVFMVLFAVGLSMVGAIAIEPMIAGEIQTGMNRTVRSMPISYKTNVLSHYATMGILAVIGFAIAMIFLLLAHVTVSKISGLVIGLVALVELIVVAFLAIKICLTNICKTQAITNWIFMGIIFLVSIIIAIINKVYSAQSSPFDVTVVTKLLDHKVLGSVIVVSVCGVITAISVLLSLNMRRGEE